MAMTAHTHETESVDPYIPRKTKGVFELTTQPFWVHMSIGYILALLTVLIFTKLPIFNRLENEFQIAFLEQELVEIEILPPVEEITPTRQLPALPPRPEKPSSSQILPWADPEVVPDDASMDSIKEYSFDATIDQDNPLKVNPLPTRGVAPEDEGPVELPPLFEDKKTTPEVFVIVEEMPQLIGGIGTIHSVLEYPMIARLAEVEGSVVLQFVVDETGRIKHPVVIKSLGAGCDEAAIKALEQARYIPGKQRGKPVRVMMSMAIKFKLLD